VEDPQRGAQTVELATRDTPAQLKAALATAAAEREESQAAQGQAPGEKRGLLVSLRRIWGGD
jgi:hypothetical protein